MPPGELGKTRERRSWVLRYAVPGLDRRGNGKVVRMGSFNVERQLQRTGRKGTEVWEKTTPSQAETRRGEGKAPPGGWVGQGRLGPGKAGNSTGQPTGERKEGAWA